MYLLNTQNQLHLFKSTINNLREITDAAKELKTELYATIQQQNLKLKT